MLWPQTGATYYNAQLGLPGKGRATRRGCLLCSMSMIYDLWDGSVDKRKVRGLFPYCGQYDYRAQVLQHSIETYRYIKQNY